MQYFSLTQYLQVRQLARPTRAAARRKRENILDSEIFKYVIKYKYKYSKILSNTNTKTNANETAAKDI